MSITSSEGNGSKQSYTEAEIAKMSDAEYAKIADKVRDKTIKIR